MASPLDFLQSLASGQTGPLLAPSLPIYQKQLTDQQSNGDIQTLLSRYPTIAPSYQALQQSRLTSGAAPYSAPVIGHAIAAAGQHRAITPEPDGNLVQNFIGDIGNIATSIPKLPFALAHELTEIPHLQERFNEAGGDRATNPAEFLGSVARSPGFRFIPGSYIASQFAPGGEGVSGFAKHPLYTALDVLPYASKAAGLTETVKAAEEATRAAAGIADTADVARVPLRTPPIRTFIENYHPGGVQYAEKALDEAGDIMAPKALKPNVIGRAVQGAQDTFANTAIGRPLATAFGNNARDLTEMANRSAPELHQNIPGLQRNPLERVAFDTGRNIDAAMATDFADLTPAERTQTFYAAQGNDATAMADLSPRQQQLADATRAHSETLANAAADEGSLVAVPYSHGTEHLPPEPANIITRRRSDAQSAFDAVDNSYADKYAEAGAIPDSTQAVLSDIRDAMGNYDWEGARAQAEALKALDPFNPAAIKELRSTLKELGNAEAKAVPARWSEVLKKGFESKVADKLGNGELALPPEISQAAALDATAKHLYSTFMSPADIDATLSEVKDTWREVAANSEHQPVFIHHTSPGRARNLMTPHFTSRKMAVGAFNERMFDGTTNLVTDPLVAMKAETLEIVQKYVADRLIERIQKTYGVDGEVLRQRILPTLDHDLVDVEPAVQEAIARTHEQWNPDSFLSPGRFKEGSTINPAGDLYLPREVASTLRDLSSELSGQLSRASNPLMKVFRASVLFFSPRFYANNIGGGAIMAAGQVNPLSFAKYGKTAMAMARDPEALMKLADGTEIARTEFRNAPAADAELQGATEYLGSINAKDPAQVGGLLQGFEAGKAVRKFANSLQDKGARANAFIDQTYSNIGLLEGFEGGLKKGLSREESMRLGVEQSRRIFETWDRLTPAERGIIRNIFPFYGFTRHILRYVMQYPSTHPTRLAILSSIAKAEEADMGSGLPAQLQRLLFIGSTDTDGKVTAFNPGGLNPFQDVASYASLLGFFGPNGGKGTDLSAITRNINPLLSTTLKQLGVDTSAGQADLYPDLYYDATTGALKAKTGNALMDLASSIVPQSQVLTNVLGFNEDYSRQLRTNPAGAGRSLMAAMGIPAYAKTVDLPQERMKAEILRYTQSKKELAAGLKSGHWDEAEQWPTLRPMIAKLKALPPEKLEQFLLPQGQGIGTALKGGVTGG